MSGRYLKDGTYDQDPAWGFEPEEQPTRWGIPPELLGEVPTAPDSHLEQENEDRVNGGFDYEE